MSVLLQNSPTTTDVAGESSGQTIVNSAIMHAASKPDVSDSSDETCPVIRANQVILSAASSGRLRVLFF